MIINPSAEDMTGNYIYIETTFKRRILSISVIFKYNKENHSYVIKDLNSFNCIGLTEDLIIPYSSLIVFFHLMEQTSFPKLLPYQWIIPATFKEGNYATRQILNYNYFPIDTIGKSIHIPMIKHFFKTVSQFIYQYHHLFPKGKSLNPNLTYDCQANVMIGMHDYKSSDFSHLSIVDDTVKSSDSCTESYLTESIKPEMTEMELSTAESSLQTKMASHGHMTESSLQTKMTEMASHMTESSLQTMMESTLHTKMTEMESSLQTRFTELESNLQSKMTELEFSVNKQEPLNWGSTPCQCPDIEKLVEKYVEKYIKKYLHYEIPILKQTTGLQF